MHKNNEHFFASNKGFGGISNIANFNSFKTKEFPTKSVLQITLLISNITFDKFGLSEQDILFVDGGKFNIITSQNLFKIKNIIC